MSDTATETRADAEQDAGATTGMFIWYELMTTDQVPRSISTKVSRDGPRPISR
jgi:hypothetical protein